MSFAANTAFCMLSWFFLSNTTILYNKWIIGSTPFRYPILLTTWHLVFITIATQILSRTTSVLDGRKKVHMNSTTYLQKVAPIALLYSASLVTSNVAYLYLNVPFIQMLKAAGPVVAFFSAWIWGLESLSLERIVTVVVISASVALAISGEILFSWLGFAYQMASLVFDSNRLVMIQLLLSEESHKMDALVSLYYVAPISAVMNLSIAWATEMNEFQFSDVVEAGIGHLVLNALTGFMLNVAIFTLIGKTSGLTMALAGILKNLALILVSSAIWHTYLSWEQIAAYSIALGGLVVYTLRWEGIMTRFKKLKAWVSRNQGSQVDSELGLKS